MKIKFIIALSCMGLLVSCATCPSREHSSEQYRTYHHSTSCTCSSCGNRDHYSNNDDDHSRLSDNIGQVSNGDPLDCTN